jgi:hypothetical protein
MYPPGLNATSNATTADVSTCTGSCGAGVAEVQIQVQIPVASDRERRDREAGGGSGSVRSLASIARGWVQEPSYGGADKEDAE